jgi:hypothetical protein
MHFELPSETALHVRRVCTHAALLGDISFLAGCILGLIVLTKYSFGYRNAFVLQDLNDQMGTLGR